MQTVDSGAKEATRCQTNDRRLKHPDVRSPGPLTEGEVYEVRLRDPGGETTVILNPKKQLREYVSEWLMKKYDYKRTVLDMWKNPEEPHGLDPKASTPIFGKGVGNEVG
eukprot:3730338-Pyramimonas_sp.AAC.1